MKEIEQIGNFIFTEALWFKDLGIEFEDEEIDETAPLRFNIKRVIAYNEGKRGLTVINLSKGLRYNINIDFKEFDKYMRKELTREVMN